MELAGRMVPVPARPAAAGLAVTDRCSLVPPRDFFPPFLLPAAAEPEVGAVLLPRVGVGRGPEAVGVRFDGVCSAQITYLGILY